MKDTTPTIDQVDAMRVPCDTSLVILQSALDRPDGTLLPFRSHDRRKTAKCVAKLLRRQWVIKVPTLTITDPAWKTMRGGQDETLVITEAGLEGLNLEPCQWPSALRRA